MIAGAWHLAGRLARRVLLAPLHEDDRRHAVIEARAIPTGFPAGDSAYNGITTTPDGWVWFAVSTHQRQEAARLFRWRVGSTAPELVLDARTLDAASVRHGKIHTRLIAIGETLYAATSRSDVVSGGKDALPPGYPGGRFLAITGDRGVTDVLATAPAGLGVITLGADERRGLLYGLTWPRGSLLRLDLGDRVLREVYAGDATGNEVCRCLAVDPRDGRVFWSTAAGAILGYDPAHDRATEVAAAAGTDARWRQIAWHEGEGAFVGVTQRPPRLFRFDPQGHAVTRLVSLTAPSFREGVRQRWAPNATLALEIANDGTVWALASGAALQARDGRRVRQTAHLLAFTPSGAAAREPALIRLDDGRYPTLSQSLALGHGAAWAVPWIETPPGGTLAAQLAHHRRIVPPESQGAIEEAALMRIPLP